MQKGINMKKKLKEEYQPGGSKRHEIIKKAVTYLKDPKFWASSRQEIFLARKSWTNNFRIPGGFEQSSRW
jgi:hypothetical protein